MSTYNVVKVSYSFYHVQNRSSKIIYIVVSDSKQNRSTEGCSKLKRSVDMTSSGKNGLNIRTNASPKWDRTFEFYISKYQFHFIEYWHNTEMT